MIGGIALMVPLLLVTLAEASWSVHDSAIFAMLLLVGGGFLLLGWYDDRHLLSPARAIVGVNRPVRHRDCV